MKDVLRHKCQFCLSFCSVFVVVLSILVVVSITELGPIIFLNLSEKQVGEYDGMMQNIFENTESFEYWDESDSYMLNYTAINKTLTEQDGGK